MTVRTDPWRWYCRLCGATGSCVTDVERNVRAFAHLRHGPCGEGVMLGQAAFGHLLHVWSYGESDPKGAFPVVVIYSDPADYPDRYVVRRQWAHPGWVDVELEPLGVADSLDEARVHVPDRHDFCIERQQADDPKIVESWI